MQRLPWPNSRYFIQYQVCTFWLGCFIPLLKSPKKKGLFALLCMISNSQEHEMNPGILEHQVAYVSMRWTCTNCEDNGLNSACKFVLLLIHHWPDANHGHGTRVMIRWRICQLVLNAFGQNMKLSCGHQWWEIRLTFCLAILYRRKLAPKLVMTGLKIYDITVKKNDVVSCISRQLPRVATPLDSLKKTFALDVEEKMFFPYFVLSPWKHAHQRSSLAPHWKLHPVKHEVGKACRV